MNKSLLLTLILLFTPFCNATLNLHKKVLDNGLTILVLPRNTTPEVMFNMVIGVGSRDEETHEKGIAHLIEHMIFKGTEIYSETDMNLISYKLSAQMNAQTSYDFTQYHLNVPSVHWHHVLPIMAEIITNCSLKDDHLDSEFKVVLQEMKMRRDRYEIALFEELFKTIFTPHPYSHPIIGYKQDIWNLHSDDLKKFYKKHYHPNNAALVIVGDVKPESVFEQCKTVFSHLKPEPNYKRTTFNFTTDTAQKNVILYRSVQHPKVTNAYALPGLSSANSYMLNLLPRLLGLSTHTGITKQLIDDEQLVTSCHGGLINLHDQSLLLIDYEPKNINDIQKIDTIIQNEIITLSLSLNKEKIERAINQERSLYYNGLQSNKALAFAISNFFANGKNPEDVLVYFENPDIEEISAYLKKIVNQNLRATKCHKGIIMPLNQEDASEWLTLQEFSDAQDQEILQERVRITHVEEPKFAPTLITEKSQSFNFAQPTIFTLDNKLTVLAHHNPDIPKIELILNLKVNELYDPEGKDGLADFVSAMLKEGTKNYSKEQLIDEFESRGMNIGISSGSIHISLMQSDLKKALELVHELVINAQFPEEALEKIRTKFHRSIDAFWDNPGAIAQHLTQKHMYGDQRYGQHLATHETIDAITQKDLADFYTKFYSPVDAQLVLVGDLANYNIPELVNKTLSQWQGSVIHDLDIQKVPQSEPTTLTHYMDRDQVVLFMIGNSITRDNVDFDKILLFDQIFGSGQLGSMNSRLFMLREQTGIFYTPQGSLLANCTSHKDLPGIIQFGSLISKDNVDTAEMLLKNLADTVVDTITEQELEQAKQTICFATVPRYSTNIAIANSFLYLHKLGLPFDYFNNRMDMLQNITLDQVKQAAKKLLHSTKLSVVKVGRI